MALLTDFVRSAHLPYVALLSVEDINAYAPRILQNRREYGKKKYTLQLLKACQKGTHTDFWEALYMQVFRHNKVLIDEQQVNVLNPLFVLAKIPYILCLELYPVQHTSSYRTPRTQTKR